MSQLKTGNNVSEFKSVKINLPATHLIIDF